MPTLNKFDEYDACMDVYAEKVGIYGHLKTTRSLTVFD
jgi:hypothetical protein